MQQHKKLPKTEFESNRNQTRTIFRLPTFVDRGQQTTNETTKPCKFDCSRLMWATINAFALCRPTPTHCCLSSIFVCFVFFCTMKFFLLFGCVCVAYLPNSPPRICLAHLVLCLAKFPYCFRCDLIRILRLLVCLRCSIVRSVLANIPFRIAFDRRFLARR